MNGHAMASLAGSSSGRNSRLGAVAIVCVIVLAAFAGSSAPAAIAAVSPKGVTGFFGTGTGEAAGQLNTPRGVAVKQEGTGAGNVYAVDGTNSRVVVFDSNGKFLRTFGADVVLSGPDQANEVQAVDVNAASGNFTLTFNSQTTLSISATATAAQVQTELNALSSIGGLTPTGSVTVTGGPGDAGGTTPYRITFGGSLAATNVAQITATNVSLAGGTPATAITANTVSNGETGFEICVPANGDACKKGANSAFAGGLEAAQGIAIYQTSGDVYVTNQGNRRIEQYDQNGNFIRAFGQDVVNTGFPGNVVATSAVQTLAVPAAVTGGTFKLSFGGQSTGWSASGTLTCDGASTTVAAVSSFAGLSLGEEISSSGATCIQPGTKVSAFNSGAGTITLSQATENNLNGGVASLSADLPYNVSAANLREALEKLSTIGAGNVTVSGAYTITYAGALANNPEPLLGVNSAGLTGGTATIANTTTGASGFEICAAASSAVCMFGPTGTTGGALGGSLGQLAVAPPGAPNAGDVLVAEPSNRRVQEFSAAGSFVRAFGFNVVAAGPDQANETQTVTVNATSGNFTITFNSVATGNISATATASAVETALNGLNSISAGGGSVTVTGGPGNTGGTTPYVITFNGGPLAHTNVNQVSTANVSLLGGSPSSSVTAATTNEGVIGFEACSAAAGDACQAGAAGAGTGQFGTGTPNRVAEDASGNLYTVETAANFRVQKFVMPAAASVAITASGAFDTTDIPGTSAAAPTDVAVNPTTNSNVLVTRAFALGATPNCPITGASSPAESRVLEISSGGTTEGTHGTCAGLTPANGLAARQSTGDLYLSSTSGASRLFVLNTGQPAAPAASITNVTGVGAHAATISAFVNPNGPELPYGTETTYKFEYKRSADPSYTTSTEAASAGNRTTNKLLSLRLDGLQAATSYDVRLTATKPFGSGSVTTTPFSFTTATSAPGLTLVSPVGLAGTTAYFQGTVNPNNSTTSYRFEYVDQAGFEASGFAGATRVPSPDASVSAEPAKASGANPLLVANEVTGLQPGTTYHLRLLATNGAGIATSAPLTFTVAAVGGCPNESIREAQKSVPLPNGSTYLPACMALEMVSPPQKFNQGVRAPAVSADGGRVLFNAQAVLGEATGYTDPIHGAFYVASRGASGWTTASIAPPGGEAAVTAYGTATFAPDYAHWLQVNVATHQQAASRTSQALYGDLGGLSTPLSPPMVTLDPSTELVAFESVLSRGASADMTHLYILPGGGKTSFAANDPVPTGSLAHGNIYVAYKDAGGAPSLALLARDGAGKAWGGNCGAFLGGGLPGVPDTGPFQVTRNQGAVSADGSRVYFSTRPGQAATGACSNASNKVRILKRTEAPAGPQISELISNECIRVSPPCDSVSDGNDLYQGASLDGTKVYFTTNRQLASSDLDGTAAECSNSSAVAGCDLYLYDSTLPAGQRLIQVSAGEVTPNHPAAGSGAKVLDGLTAISTDGSHVYFVAEGVLTGENAEGKSPSSAAGARNLYLYERDGAHPGGRLAFIATVGGADGGVERELWGRGGTFKDQAYPVPALGRDAEGNEVGGDGHILVFQSSASLTANDTDGGHFDVFRYDAEASAMTCLSCAPGGSDSAAFDVAPQQINTNGSPGPDFAERARWVSEDGRTVVFKTAQPLLPGDVVSGTAATTFGSKTLTAVVTASGSGTLASGSRSVTGVTAATGAFLVGQSVTGTGIPAGATIAAVGSGTLELSAAATASGTQALSAGAQPFAVGQTIAGAGIPAGTTVTAVSGQTLTVSANATASASGVAVSGYPFRSYLWRDGQLFNLPGTADTSGNLKDAPVLSPDGSTVAFQSYAQLLPQDGDTARDVYIARAAGGFPIPPPPHVCTGEECQGASSAQPGQQGAASESAAGANVTEPPQPCRKGYVRRQGRCVKKHHKKAAHKKAHKRHANTNRRAGK